MKKLKHKGTFSYIIIFTILVSCSSPEKKLMDSIQSSNLTEVEKLLKDGVNPNNAFKSGLTPLTLAIETSKSKIIATLIDFDADINMKDRYGYTPFVKAVSSGNIKICNIIMDAGCEINMEDSLAQEVLLSIKNPELMTKLKDKEVNFDIASNKGVTLTMRAAKAGNFELLKYLVSDKAKRIYKKDSLDKTVFDYAQGMDNDSIMVFLEEAKRLDKIWPKVGSIVYFPKGRSRVYSSDPKKEVIRSVVTNISGKQYQVKALETVRYKPSNNNRYWLERKYIFSTRAKAKKTKIRYWNK